MTNCSNVIGEVPERDQSQGMKKIDAFILLFYVSVCVFEIWKSLMELYSKARLWGLITNGGESIIWIECIYKTNNYNNSNNVLKRYRTLNRKIEKKCPHPPIKKREKEKKEQIILRLINKFL